MRVLVGGFVFGLILYFVPGHRSGPACLIAGWLAAMVVEWTAPRSFVEKLALLMSVSIIAWVAGPMAARGQSLFAHLLGWALASSALAFYTRPRAQ